MGECRIRVLPKIILMATIPGSCLALIVSLVEFRPPHDYNENQVEVGIISSEGTL